MGVMDRALQALRAGGIVGVPTDTVYGLAVDPANPEAVQRLYDLKGRGAGHPLPVLVASLAQAEQIAEFGGVAVRLALEHWPGPLTIVVTATVDMVAVHEGTLGLRVPDHPAAIWILDAFGPLAVTSANRTGEPPVLDDEAARDLFGDAVDVYIGGVAPGGEPSTVLDCTQEPPVLLRPGPVG